MHAGDRDLYDSVGRQGPRPLGPSVGPEIQKGHKPSFERVLE
ncbi:hypothetical protein HMPREF1861_02414 [Corynebacterium kroppenstedtii]|nr:hypothetical protein HMPREF1861_02414 [Corynebacterium kroppenstedtii]